MVKVVCGNNVKRNTVIVDESATLRQILESSEVDYTRGMTMIDGCALNPGDLDKSLTQMGITEKCYLLNVVKADNANE